MCGGGGDVDLRCENISAIFEGRVPGHRPESHRSCGTGSDPGGLICVLAPPHPARSPSPPRLLGESRAGTARPIRPVPSLPVPPSPVPLRPRYSHSEPCPCRGVEIHPQLRQMGSPGLQGKKVLPRGSVSTVCPWHLDPSSESSLAAIFITITLIFTLLSQANIIRTQALDHITGSHPVIHFSVPRKAHL